MERFDEEITSQTGKDLRRGFARWRVYRFLRPPVLSFVDPKEVKVMTIQVTLRMSPNAVVDALDFLTERGYLVEHGRSQRKVRKLSLAWDIIARKTA